MIGPWKKVSSKPLADFRIFRVRSDVRMSPRTGAEHDFYVIDTSHWVNVIARTAEDELVMIEQFRHGSETVELEIPGGMIDPTDASPMAAGVRELREETGYEGEGARIIGEVFPNPAIMSNVCYTVFVDNCRCVHPLQWDHAEEMATRLIPVREIGARVAKGEVRHSLVVAALYYFELLRRP